MEAKAIIMTLVGFFLLYGGLACCIGIAWYHSKLIARQKQEQEDRKAL